jgi:hypothetical protein
MGDALDRRLPVRDEGGIAGEERIDQHGVAGEIESEGGVAEPGDLHDGHPCVSGKRARREHSPRAAEINATGSCLGGAARPC